MARKPHDPKLDKEKAEGERQTVDEALGYTEAATDREGEGGATQLGISNRPVEEEDEQQAQLPPRGHAKREE